jgi:hypothetical protein
MRARRGRHHDSEIIDARRQIRLLMELALGPLYSESAVQAGITTEVADLLFASLPYKLMHAFHIPIYQQIASRDADIYERLRKVGFLPDFGDMDWGCLRSICGEAPDNTLMSVLLN